MVAVCLSLLHERLTSPTLLCISYAKHVFWEASQSVFFFSFFPQCYPQKTYLTRCGFWFKKFIIEVWHQTEFDVLNYECNMIILWAGQLSRYSD